jgi:hypothetical protein
LAAFFFTIFAINCELDSPFIVSVHPKREAGLLAAIETMTRLVTLEGDFLFIYDIEPPHLSDSFDKVKQTR